MILANVARLTTILPDVTIIIDYDLILEMLKVTRASTRHFQFAKIWFLDISNGREIHYAFGLNWEIQDHYYYGCGR